MGHLRKRDELYLTQCLKIEEALKLYQNALKLHSQGSDFFAEAEAAYDELFASEIFKYPESLSEEKWLEIYGDADLDEDANEVGPDVSLPAAALDTNPNSLPQILYLAHKNFGQFRLDKLKYRLSRLEIELLDKRASKVNGEINQAANTGLEHLAEALGRDDSDLELWRRVSRLSEYLGSHRLARFCLESVLDEVEDSLVEEPDFSNLEHRFAAERLRHILQKLQDPASESQLREMFEGRRLLQKSLKSFVDPCPYLPETPLVANTDRIGERQASKQLSVLDYTWAGVGSAIISQHQQDSQGTLVIPSGVLYLLDIPAMTSQPAACSHALTPLNVPSETQPENAMIEDEVVDEPTKEIVAVADREIPLGSPDTAGTELKPNIGTDSDGPTSGSAKASNEAIVTDAEALDGQLDQVAKEPLPVPSSPRKRSSDEAELLDNNESTRGRSKRIKARKSAHEPLGKLESAEESARWYTKQMDIYVQADDLTFRFVDGILSKLQCKTIGSVQALKTHSQPNTHTAEGEVSGGNGSGIRSFRRLLDTWDQSKSRAFVKGSGLKDPSKTAQNPDVSNVLQYSMQDGQRQAIGPELSSEDLVDFLQETGVAHKAFAIEELGMRWLVGLLASSGEVGKSNLYLSHQWPESLKAIVVQFLVELDVHIWHSLNDDILQVPFEMIQSIFELHLDIYGRITNPDSKVDQATRNLQRDRLSRWSMLANQNVETVSTDDVVTLSNLEIRFLWSTIVSSSFLEPDSSAPSVVFYQDLIRILRLQRDYRGEEVVISLTNNAVMPQISISAAEKEVSRITTVDFFTTIFSTDDKDPFSVIEKLQPLLDLSVEGDSLSGGDTPKDSTDAFPRDNGALPATTGSDSTMLEALRFLNQSNVALKLFLWQKLRDAYGSINFPPMILSCNLRSFALIIGQLSSSLFGEGAQEKDLESYLHWLHKLDDLLTPILALILTDVKALDCIDYDHLLSVISSMVSLLQILHTFTMWEDCIRVGQISAPAQPGSAAIALQTKSAEKFRDMIIKSWALLYLFIKEATFQNLEIFSTRNEDLLTYLRLVHYCLGTRTYCSFNNKMLLKIERTEMLRLKGTDGWDTDMPQVIYDLYGLKISSESADTQDHACEAIDVDKKTAFDVLDTIILQVNRLSTKDLLKHDLRFAVDKLQQVIKVPKISDTTSPRGFNKRLINNYLKSAINPMELFRSNKGEGQLNGMRVNTDGSDVARRGWYFLLGHIALTKFRSQKRITAAATEDLENAKMFFKLDLEFDNEKWETWFRLGQVFDSLLDEQTTWTADKLDRDQSSLVELQRQAVLCYNMALAIACRTEDLSLEEASKIADLCKDYGNRLYSSSREPFTMKAFSLEEFERLYNRERSGMYKREPYRPLSLYRAWKISSALLHRACCDKPTDWTTWYALGKVLWKMHSCSDETLNGTVRISYQKVINALVHAIEAVPDKRDNKQSEKDPTLEPHYKLLTVVHKLVQRQTVSVEEACQILEVTHFSRRAAPIQDPEEWVDYMQEILSAMKAADKSNWHHRLVARAARTIYETDPDDPRTWLGAKHELTQQIFTKTMTIQVWRPENERCGRHFVYTGRYVHFLLEILYKLKDKESVEALAKRIRKKSGDFVNHLNVWYDLCGVYLLILRERIEGQVGFKIEPGFDETYFKNINLEEFQANAVRIEAWIHKPSTACSEVDTLRDAIEFKKLNNKLLKESEVETTIADIYTAIYATQAEKLRLKETEEENRVRMRVDNILFNPITADHSKKEPSPLPDQEPTKRRFNVITHREVIRRAEALMTKPPPIATPKTAHQTLPLNTLDQTRSPGIAVVIPTRENSRDNASAPATPNSVRSIHDSADDESELSDLDEDDAAGYETAQEEEMKDAMDEDQPKLQPRRSSMFPNTMGFSATNEAAVGDQDGRGETSHRQPANQVTADNDTGAASAQFANASGYVGQSIQAAVAEQDTVMGEVSD